MILIHYADSRQFESVFSLEQLLKQLPPHLQEEIRGYIRPQDRYIRALGKWMLTKMLELWGYEAGHLAVLQKNPYGKPFLPPPLSFNISHSAHGIMVALTSRAKVGIDIEHVRPIDYDLLKDNFSASEWIHILEDQSQRRLFEIWAQKESIIKADGRGMFIEWSNILIHKQQARIIDAADQWFLYPLAVEKEFVSYLCADVAQADIRLKTIRPEEFSG